MGKYCPPVADAPQSPQGQGLPDTTLNQVVGRIHHQCIEAGIITALPTRMTSEVV